MAGITLDQAQSQLTIWLAASAKVAAGQSYSIGDRELTRADADAVLKQVQYWQNMVDRLSGNTAAGIRVGLGMV